jgi:hypothetical protein
MFPFLMQYQVIKLCWSFHIFSSKHMLFPTFFQLWPRAKLKSDYENLKSYHSFIAK